MEALGGCYQWPRKCLSGVDLGDGRAVVASASLPRKEVIQPHVPVRLPCYDFVTVTHLTLGACLACALAQRLQVLLASMT